MPILDNFQSVSKGGFSSPYDNGVDVTPSDSADLAFRTRALWVGGAGNVAVRWPNGTSQTFQSVAAGTLLPFRVDRVLSTGTTATNIKALE
jgi:hypothetical protein